MLHIKHIFIYPVKSLPGVAVESSEIDKKGLINDREWMLVDPNGNFITQRKFPQMTHIVAELSQNKLGFNFHGQKIDINNEDFSIPGKATLWDDIVDVLQTTHQVNTFLSDILKTKCSLVKIHPSAKRSTTLNNGFVKLNDRQPLLIVNTNSLNAFNNHLANPITFSNFRPNIVYDGKTPFEEENWEHFNIGNLKMKGEGACKRCKMINIDQENGLANPLILKTLGEAQKGKSKGIPFGLLASPLNEGSIKINDIIEVL